MKETSKKFPAVMTTQSVLGIEEGTVLRFDWYSGKYVSIEEEEDIAEDYYYSGYAVALDPYVVKDNIGTYFTYIEQGTEPNESENIETSSVTPPEKDMEDQLSVEESKEEPIVDFPEYTKEHDLVADCSCGYRHFLQTINAPGINLTLMAEDKDSCIELACPNCKNSVKLWFAQEIDKPDEPTDKESN